jgi:NAD dependent epimerase/dehydratase family enzyme
MLPPFRLGAGGPVAGGAQPMSWIHVDDEVGMLLAALDDDRWSGPVNACAPQTVTNKEFSTALGRALHRPAVVPVPGLALRALYGEMASIITTGVRMAPARAQDLGYGFAHPDLDEALRAALDA